LRARRSNDLHYKAGRSNDLHYGPGGLTMLRDEGESLIFDRRESHGEETGQKTWKLREGEAAIL
jgi:hypothetical protein